MSSLTRTATRRTVTRISAALAATAVLAAACDSDGRDATAPAATAATTADVVDFTYVPAELVVTVGTTVTWTNQDRFGHTVTAGPAGAETGEFDLVLGLTSDADTTGLAASRTFDEVGTFAYFCRYHPSMVGTVVVTA